MNIKHRHLANISTAGITLIEVVLTICILALLAGLSYSSYNSSKLHALRNDGKEAVLNVQGLVERYLTLNNLAPGALTDDIINAQFPTYASNSVTPEYSKDHLYQIALTTSGSGYAISATAIDNGAPCSSSDLKQQCQDLLCRQIVIDNYNKVSYDSTGTLADATTTTCW